MLTTESCDLDNLKCFTLEDAINVSQVLQLLAGR